MPNTGIRQFSVQDFRTPARTPDRSQAAFLARRESWPALTPLVRNPALHLVAPFEALKTPTLESGRANIYGTRAVFDAKGRLTGNIVSPEEYAPVWKAGKSAAIERFVKRAPVLVAGDSDGDVHMLTHFPQTQVRLIIDRLRRGEISALVAQGSTSPHLQRGPTRTVVQKFHAPPPGSQ